jgi:ribosomal protein S18 acetylase RimI-like enzyme
MGYFVPFKGEKGFEIVEFLVETNYQNQGIGNKLLIQLELNLHQNNYDYIWLLTAKDSSAESFYSKRNYQRDCKIVLLNKEL